MELDDYPVVGDSDHRVIEGIWLPESKDPTKALFFPEQVSITCSNSEKTCRELIVPLGIMGCIVEVMNVEEKGWEIRSWDAHGLLASYQPDSTPTAAASDRCHHRVLTMTFASGAC